MNIKSIKKDIGHTDIINSGYVLHEIKRGFFMIDGIITLTVVLHYLKNKYISVHSIAIEVGYQHVFYNRFGMIK